MPPPKMSYFSVPVAAKTFDIQLEYICWAIESGYLPAYVVRYSRPRRYAMIIKPFWKGDSLEYCCAVDINKLGGHFESKDFVYLAGRHYDSVLVKYDELEALLQNQNNENKIDIYSLKDIANHLCISIENAFGLISSEDSNLVSAIEFSMPCEVAHIIGDFKYSYVLILGKTIFDASKLQFDADGYASLLSIYLHQNGEKYLLRKERTISKSDIFVTMESLKQYLIKEGYAWIEQASDNQSLELNTLNEIIEHVSQLRLKSLSDKEIAKQLLEMRNSKGKKLSKEMVGRAIHPNLKVELHKTTFTKQVTKLLKN